MHILVNEFIPYRQGHNTVTISHGISPQPPAYSLTQPLFLSSRHFVYSQAHVYTLPLHWLDEVRHSC